eukprot:g2872.t1
MPTEARIAAAEAVGQLLHPVVRAAQLVYPILDAESRGKRRWCAWCLQVKVDECAYDREVLKLRGYSTCARCSEVGYCSAECQGKHWRRAHKKRCPLLAAEHAEAAASEAAGGEGKEAGGGAASSGSARRGGKKKNKGRRRAAQAAGGDAAGGDGAAGGGAGRIIVTRAAEETTGPWPPYDDGGDLWGGAGGKVGVGSVGREFLAVEAAKGGEEEGQGGEGAWQALYDGLTLGTWCGSAGSDAGRQDPCGLCNALVTCDAAGTRVRRIQATRVDATTASQTVDPRQGSIRGRMTDAVGDLHDSLELLSIKYEDNLSGTLSSALARLTLLTGLSLDGTRTSGTIPEALLDLTNLLYFKAQAARLSGTLPSAAGLLNTMEGDDCPRQVAVGADMGKCVGPRLNNIAISMNGVSGTVPAAWGRLTRLTSLLLADNPISGPLQTTIDKLRDLPQLKTVSMARTNLTGHLTEWPAETFRKVSTINLNGLALGDTSFLNCWCKPFNRFCVGVTSSAADTDTSSDPNFYCRGRGECLEMYVGWHVRPRCYCASHPGMTHDRTRYNSPSFRERYTGIDCGHQSVDPGEATNMTFLFGDGSLVQPMAAATGFARRGKFGCGKCPDDNASNVAILFGLVLFVALMVVFLIWKRSKKAGAFKGSSAMKTIILDSAQVTALFTGMVISWPPVVQDTFEVVAASSSLSTETGVSLSCALPRGGPVYPRVDRRVLHKLVDQSIAAVPAIGESGVDTLRRVKGKLRGVETMLSLRHRVSMARDAAAISAATEEDFDPSWIDHVALSSLAVGYILYPSFTKTWLSFFSCKSVQTSSSSSSKYLTVDLRVECWSEKHQSMLQQVAYPATIIVAGFPLLVAALLALSSSKARPGARFTSSSR